jgi:hypothetical protein
MKARKIQSGLMMAKAIPVGTKVTCPKCRVVIGVTRVSMPMGITVEEKFFTWAKPFHFKNGDRMTCPVCPGEVWWMSTGSLHTDRGWIPELNH